MLAKNNTMLLLTRGLVILLLSVMTAVVIHAASPSGMTSLQAIKIYPLPENRIKISLTFSSPLTNKLNAFTTKQPSQLVVDFPGVSDQLSEKDKMQNVNVGILRQITTVQANNRTRLVLKLNQLERYSTEVSGNHVNITLVGKYSSVPTPQGEKFISTAPANTHHQISAIDFRANQDKGGRVVVNVSDPNMSIDVKQRGSVILVDFMDTNAPSSVFKRLDVSDFSTPVQTIDARKKGNKTIQLSIQSKGDFEHFAYQVGRKFIIDITPMSADANASANTKAKLPKDVFTGNRISLNFQNIKVRSVLQLLADFTNTNMVVSDTVTGNITLRLNNVPWDQALAIILKTRGLEKRKMGSVMLIAPADEIAKREKDELESQKQVDDLTPLHSELIQINYAKATDIAALLKEKGNSLLSSRGNVSVDTRTNTLWIQDTTDQLEDIRSLVEKLDIPVKQVLIEARVVMVNRSFEKDLGIRFGVSRPNHLSGTLNGANQILALTPGTSPATVPFTDRLNLDLPAIPSSGSAAASVGLALASLGNNVLLDLELSALESEGRGEVIASPRVITANQQPAVIDSGEEIPYQQATSSGATSVAFKEAVLKLQVTPQITPDNKIILNLQVNQDTASAERFNGVPSILTKEIKTNVLVDNGQTVVLGGIYNQTNNSAIQRIPFLGKLPVVGVLFRNTTTTVKRDELLIFVTPKIIQQTYVTN